MATTKKRRFTKQDKEMPLLQIHNIVCNHILAIAIKQKGNKGELDEADSRILISYGKYLKEQKSKGEDKSFSKLTDQELDDLLKENLGLDEEELEEVIKEELENKSKYEFNTPLEIPYKELPKENNV